jgi:hypothetical protein
MPPTVSLAEQVDRVAQRLSEEYAATVPAPVVRTIVSEIYGQLSTARVTQFVPVLIDRGVRERLRHWGPTAA